MRILVVGAGAVGRSIATQLITHGHDVVIVDHDPDSIKVSLVPDADWILADACSPTQLEEAGARDADAIAAVTGDDKVNLVVSLLAKTEFGVPQVIARANHTANEWMYDESWGVDVLASTPRMLTTLVEEAVSVGEMVELLAIGSSSTSVYQIEVPRGSVIVGADPSAITMPDGLILAAIVSNGQPISPARVQEIAAGDELIIICGRNSDKTLAALEAMIS
ncbi:TrkA family potassium uptake protein [Schaalia sp. JY-X159]|uniref:potassium channel family protein n=1 Tax=Schaalia sp. JY-X159 TaxID=2758575 RepID=UPI00165D493A|nr:TrkA family potassium uptake protein [Schaalia sp. JY-X159]